MEWLWGWRGAIVVAVAALLGLAGRYTEQRLGRLRPINRFQVLLACLGLVALTVSSVAPTREVGKGAHVVACALVVASCAAMLVGLRRGR